ncbi:T9SS type A sorting domain-containing protein [Flavobacterium amniphilum]|uniref:GEVED domain-containing protein n=1 Tax=Flavobacterium amniphilum TaxID=1834035 RepID=UPI00202A3CF9|nr:GEVED domain-containing protein [Flavobacterium amniphilum]MCL9806479.1 T9SS type A sorting domain-containing protein [Flavobacterium amniphilum]
MMKKYAFLAMLLIHGHSQAQTTNDPGNNPGDLGSVTFNYKGTTVTYTTVRAKDGNVWLQQNLGSSNVAIAATDENSYGDCFQWGRWDDGHQNRTSSLASASLNPNNPFGLNGGSHDFYGDWWSGSLQSDTWEAATPAAATAENGCDPCKLLGVNWTTPTEANWEKLITDEEITNVAKAFASNLKLTVGGTRNATGNYSFVGQRGYYWSKTTSNTNPNYVKHLYYSNAIANPSAGTFRKQGASLRCMKTIPPVSYCTVSVDHDVEPLTLVNFADISNITSESVNGTAAYEDFTQIIGNVQRGNTYTLTVKGNTAGQFEHDIRAFLDWNNDGTFDMATEYYHTSLMPSTGTDAVEAAITIEIPANATIGTTRMRIIKDQWNVYEEGEFDACLNAYYGQVEDYTINIQENLGNDDFNATAFNIYPVPTNNWANIETTEIINTVSIYNSLGQLIAETKEKQINLSGYPNGIYFVKINFKNGNQATRSIIKN